MDWIPGLSQLKTVCQLVTGDEEGARRTQENFFRTCPVVSQVTSVVQAIAGDADGAIETQKRCFANISNVANGVPGLGHVKGIVHHAVGDHEGGDDALRSATRSTVVIGSSVAAGLVTGGAAAVTAGLVAGNAYDLTHSLISDKPKGIYAVTANALENPNAGNIFDLGIALTADALSGHSGGRIANKITNQFNINALEAVRDAKTNQLNAGVLPSEGSAHTMTSGEALSLGSEIDLLTQQIDAMKTPQYYWDPKTNSQVVERPPDLSGVLVKFGTVASHGQKHSVVRKEIDNRRSSNREQNEEKKTYEQEKRFQDAGSSGRSSTLEMNNYGQQKTETKMPEQENGLLDDLCDGEFMDALTPKDRERIIENYVYQNQQTITLQQLYNTDTIMTDKQWQLIIDYIGRDNDPRKTISKSQFEMIVQLMWLHVQMPPEFGYTGAIRVNNAYQGLEHSFIRHWDQWRQYIPGINELWQQLPEEIRILVNKVRNGKDYKARHEAISVLTEAIKHLENEKRSLVRSVLFRIQIKMYDFIRKNVSSAQYLQHGVNEAKRIQVYFKVRDSSGNVGVMVVCVSKQRFPSVNEFGDERPVRTITSVFFKTWKEYQTSKICTGKAWPKK